MVEEAGGVVGGKDVHGGNEGWVTAVGGLGDSSQGDGL